MAWPRYGTFCEPGGLSIYRFNEMLMQIARYLLTPPLGLLKDFFGLNQRLRRG